MCVPSSGRTLRFGRSLALYRINQYVVRVKLFLSEALLSLARLLGQWKLTPFLGLFQQADPFIGLIHSTFSTPFRAAQSLFILPSVNQRLKRPRKSNHETSCAKELYAAKNNTIAEIMQMTGFRSRNTFYKYIVNRERVNA
jgi:hypothetical protein